MRRVIGEFSVADIVADISGKFDRYALKTCLKRVFLNQKKNAVLLFKEGGEGDIPMYIADSEVSLKAIMGNEDEWVECLSAHSSSYCTKDKDGVEKTAICTGVPMNKLPEVDCRDMLRYSTSDNSVSIFRNKKVYSESENEQFQKRNVLALDGLAKKSLTILYFDGAEKLVEYLLRAGVGKIYLATHNLVNVAPVKKTVKDIAKRAPFSNKICFVEGVVPYKDGQSDGLVIGQERDLIECNMTLSAKYTIALSAGKDLGGEDTIEICKNLFGDGLHERIGKLAPYASAYVAAIVAEYALDILNGNNDDTSKTVVRLKDLFIDKRE